MKKSDVIIKKIKFILCIVVIFIMFYVETVYGAKYENDIVLTEAELWNDVDLVNSKDMPEAVKVYLKDHLGYECDGKLKNIILADTKIKINNVNDSTESNVIVGNDIVTDISNDVLVEILGLENFNQLYDYVGKEKEVALRIAIPESGYMFGQGYYFSLVCTGLYTDKDRKEALENPEKIIGESDERFYENPEDAKPTEVHDWGEEDETIQASNEIDKRINEVKDKIRDIEKLLEKGLMRSC